MPECRITESDDRHPPTRRADSGGPELVIRMFGPLAVEAQGRVLGPGDLGGRRPKQVLEILLAARGRPVSSDRIADMLWAQKPPRSTSGSIQTFVSVLRRRLTGDGERARRLVVTEPEAYRFATAEVDLDLDRFDELHDRSMREPAHRARRSLEEALALARGEVLEDEPYAAWAQELRRAYEGRVLGVRLDAAEAALAELDYAAALTHAEAAAALDRFGERARRTQMVALYALGRQHDALETYRRFRGCLDEELGLEPTDGIRALESAILRQDDVRSFLPCPSAHSLADNGEGSVRLLGRTTELGLLERAVRHALDGSFALLQVEGEAGLGKTRLLDELAGSLSGVRAGRASCSALEQHLPYVPLAAALRDALHDVDLDGRQLPALRPVLPELGLCEPWTESTEIDSLEALVELVGGHAPMVLFLDDLHWADTQTLAAVSYLQRRGANVPAALVTTFRRGLTPAAGSARLLKPDLLVRLEPLTAAELAPLGIPDVQEATGGNPRYVTAAVANGNRCELEPALAETVRDHCRAEGDRAYRVLLAASALEQPFDPGELAVVLRVDATELTEELERLCERRILRIDGYRFQFSYRLLGEVLRASVSPARRTLLRQRLDAPAENGSPSAGRAVSPVAA